MYMVVIQEVKGMSHRDRDPDTTGHIVGDRYTSINVNLVNFV